MALRKASWILALAAAAWLAPLSAWAHDFPHIHHWIESHRTPWYMYFPCGEPALTMTGGHGFPTWPSNFPPPQTESAWQFSMPAQPNYASAYSGPGLGYPSSAQGQPTGQTTGYGFYPNFIPVNQNMSTPSYWFAR